MPGRLFPMVIRKSGEKIIPIFPIELHPGDELIVVKEMMASRVPDGEVWFTAGYDDHGPIITRRKDKFR